VIPVLNVPKDAGSIAIMYATDVAPGYRLTTRVADSYVGSSYDESF